MWRCALVLVISVGLAAAVTVPKLYKMAQINGWQPGATITARVITNKGVDEGRRGLKHYWVSWSKNGSSLNHADRDYVSPEVWETIQEGDSVEVVRVPGDEAGYLRNGVFVEPGNFVFDYFLLAAEIITALAMAILIIIISRRGRTPALTPEFVREKITTTIQVFNESLVNLRNEIEQIVEQSRHEQSPELKNQYLKQAEEKRKAIEEIVKSRQSLDDQLKRIQHL
jgi:hypothetical protein